MNRRTFLTTLGVVGTAAVLPATVAAQPVAKPTGTIKDPLCRTWYTTICQSVAITFFDDDATMDNLDFWQETWRKYGCRMLFAHKKLGDYIPGVSADKDKEALGSMRDICAANALDSVMALRPVSLWAWDFYFGHTGNDFGWLAVETVSETEQVEILAMDNAEKPEQHELQ